MSELVGRVGGTVKGYEIHAHWDGQQLAGRIGGRLQGKNISLVLSDSNVNGILGNENVLGVVAEKKIDIEFSSTLSKHKLGLEIQSGKVVGRFSGGVDGKDIDFLLVNQELRGRVGGKMSGKDVMCQFAEEIPQGLVILAMVCTYKALEDVNKTRIV